MRLGAGVRLARRARLVALILADGAIALAPLSAGVLSTAVAAWWLHARGGRTTGAGRELLKRTRAERCDELRGTPPSNLALAVALFGRGTLWAVDPLFALALGVAHDEQLAVGGHRDAFLAGYDAAAGAVAVVARPAAAAV